MTTTKFSGLVATMLALGAVAASAAPTNLVANGGFEGTTVTHSTELPANSYATGSFLYNWQSYSPSGYSYNHLFFPGESTTVGSVCTACGGASATLWSATESPTGGNFVSFDGDSTAYGQIYQQITGLTVGQEYELSFDYAGAQYKPMNGATTEAWEVQFGNENQTTAVLSNANHGFTGWFTSTMRFTATSTDQILYFIAKGTPVGLPPVSLLDNVSLTEVVPPPPTPVPEPASLALTLAGLIGVGLSRRSKRSSAATQVA